MHSNSIPSLKTTFLPCFFLSICWLTFPSKRSKISHYFSQTWFDFIFQWLSICFLVISNFDWKGEIIHILYVLLFVTLILNIHVLFKHKQKGYTINNTYHKNLNTFLFTLSSHTQISYGFYNSHMVKTMTKWACKWDVKLDECRRSLNDLQSHNFVQTRKRHF